MTSGLNRIVTPITGHLQLQTPQRRGRKKAVDRLGPSRAIAEEQLDHTF
jgi:hypothetical protein